MIWSSSFEKIIEANLCEKGLDINIFVKNHMAMIYKLLNLFATLFVTLGGSWIDIAPVMSTSFYPPISLCT